MIDRLPLAVVTWLAMGVVCASATDILLTDADRDGNHPTDAEVIKCPAIVDLYDRVQSRGNPLPNGVSFGRLKADANDCVHILNENFGTNWTIDDAGIRKH